MARPVNPGRRGAVTDFGFNAYARHRLEAPHPRRVPEHADTAESVHRFSALLAETSRSAEAVPLAERLEIRRTILGEDSPKVAEARDTLTAARRAAGPAGGTPGR